MTLLAIVGFAMFPLMPPRLLDEPCSDYGGACLPSDLRGDDGTFSYVDTLALEGGPWSFESDTMADISFVLALGTLIGWSLPPLEPTPPRRPRASERTTRT